MSDRRAIIPFRSPARGRAKVPGSKSVTNRALILAALAEGETRLEGALFSRDTRILCAALRELGFRVEEEPASARITVQGLGGRIPARAARLHDMLLALPQGYDTVLGEGGVQLSTGQKQLLAMARALAGRPKILLLDEATANIDSATEALLGEALAQLRGRVTVIAVAHRLSTVRDADLILVLHHGQLVERGTHGELMAVDGGVYQRLVQLQQLED